MDYQFRTQPFEHQLTEWLGHRDDRVRGIFWEQGCVDAATEYLSPTGWRRMDTYEGGPVAQWHPESRRIEFVEPSAYVRLPCSEMIRLLTTRGVDQLLSPEHRVPFVDRDSRRTRVCQAQDLESLGPTAWRYLPGTFLYEGGSGLSLTDDELRLQIAVMADGHFPSRCLTNRCYVNLRRARKIERLDWLLEKTNRADKRVQKEGGWVSYAFPAPVRLKSFDSRFWIVSDHQLDIIVEEVGHWDGSIGQSSIRFYTTDKDNADFIQFAFSSRGFIASCRHDGATWVVRARRSGENLTIDGRSISRESSTDGFKYCFEVPTSFLLFRRNGWIFPSGNTGKSKETIDQACWLYKNGRINCLVVIAPDGVHSNWTAITETPETWGELQKHAPTDVGWREFTFYSSKASAKYHLARAKEVQEFEGLAVLAMTYDASLTPTGKRVLWDFLRKRECLMVLDESPRIKTPSAKRTRTLIAAGKYAPFKRILSGTPVAESPFDVYAQVRFLDPEFWVRNGIRTFSAFKQEFAVLETFQQDENGRWQKVEGMETGVSFRRDAKQFQKVKEFKNLDCLKAMMDRISTRVLKEDVLDLPEKLYQLRSFDLTREQRRIYNDLRDECIAWLSSQEFVSGILAIVKLLRLQQVTNGGVSPDGGEGIQPIEGDNPRLELMREIADDVGKGHQHIIWARFQFDIDNIAEALKRDGFRVVTYDGRTSPKDRERARNLFQDGKVDKFIANPAAAGEGLTLTASSRTTYYSNSWSLSHRLQSEDRNHRIGQRWPVLYDDIVCPGTVDFKLVQALRSKQRVSSEVLGDKLRDWLI
jgi:hypothetical protein